MSAKLRSTTGFPVSVEESLAVSGMSNGGLPSGGWGCFGSAVIPFLSVHIVNAYEFRDVRLIAADRIGLPVCEKPGYIPSRCLCGLSGRSPVRLSARNFRPMARSHAGISNPCRKTRPQNRRSRERGLPYRDRLPRETHGCIPIRFQNFFRIDNHFWAP